MSEFENLNVADLASQIEEGIEESGLTMARRSLTPGEEAFARTLFGTEIDYGEVRLTAHAVPWFKDMAFVIRNRVHFPKDKFPPDFSELTGHDRSIYLAWLAHELCHVWQYQSPEVDYHWIKALLESFRYENPYEYQIDEHDCLIDFRFEQQGAIIQSFAYWILEYDYVSESHRQVIACNIDNDYRERVASDIDPADLIDRIGGSGMLERIIGD